MNGFNDAGNAFIMSAKNRIQSFRVGAFHLAYFSHASCVHTPRTYQAQTLWQRAVRKSGFGAGGTYVSAFTYVTQRMLSPDQNREIKPGRGACVTAQDFPR
jgi:hypothetical protein